MRASTEIPGPPPANSIGGAYQLMKAVRADLLGLVLSAFEEYGDIFQIRVLGRRQVLVRSPELIRQVLVTEARCFEKGADYTSRRKGLAKFGGMGLLSSNGALWKQQRKLVAPALHAKRVAAYADAMVRAADEAMEPWRDGDVIAIDAAMMHAALHIVGRTMFHEEVGASADVIGEATHALHGMLEANNSAWTLLPEWFPTPQRLREDRAVRRIDEVVYRLIRARRPTEDGPVEDTGDLAALLLGAEYEGGGRMSDEQARDEIVTMFIAGHETAANTLGWAWVELAREPEVAAKLHAELDRVLMGRSPTADDYHALDYTRAFIKETLRRWPPAFTFLRTCVEDTQIGDFQIEKGMDVSLVPYATHRDPRFFEDPERFDPERFLGERGEAMDRYAWIPFGGGPRVCVGNAFALMETTLVLARIASRYRLELVEGQDVVPVPGVTLRPSGPLRMRVAKR